MNERKPSHLDVSTVFWGIIIGFIVGVVVWLFHVPKHGKDTRKEIVNIGKTIIGKKPEEGILKEKDVSIENGSRKYEYFR
jgi:gas vesicle protein